MLEGGQIISVDQDYLPMGRDLGGGYVHFH